VTLHLAFLCFNFFAVDRYREFGDCGRSPAAQISLELKAKRQNKKEKK
jgi:hypothetical protein